MKENIINKTLILIEKKGIDAVSMRDLAKKVGFSAMAIYRYFPNKDALLLEVAAKGFDLLTTEGKAAAEKEKIQEKRLTAVLLAYYNFGHKHKNLFELMFGPIKKKENISENFKTSARASFAAFSGYVRAYMKEKIKEDRFEHQSASGLWSFIHGMTLLSSNGYLSAMESDPAIMEKKVKLQISAAIKNL